MPEFLNGATSEPYRLEVFSIDGEYDKGTLKVVNIDNGDVLLEREVDFNYRPVFGIDTGDMVRFELMAESAIDVYEVGKVVDEDQASSVNNQGA